MKGYDVFSRSCLQRARDRLDENTTEALFYAAFELRCGIEVRMQEYLEAQEHLAASKRKGWQIPKLGHNLEQAFRLGDRVAQLTFTDLETKRPLQILYYTPVTSTLQREAGQLDRYRHGLQESPSRERLTAIRVFLEQVYAHLKTANTGTVLGPPLVKPDGRIQLYVEEEGIATELYKLGSRVIMTVKYLDELPSSD
ncbi:MAG: hypothetical protein ABSG14_08845 [Verrucomicrobiia bacterium]|jgi:hypothetical protein